MNQLKSPKDRFLPNTDQVSIIAATILLTFAMAAFINFQIQDLRIVLGNIYVTISLNIQTAITVIASILAASGADWLIRNHPLWNKRNTIEHWVLPLLTTFVLGFLIGRQGNGTYGWWSFFLGAALIMGILVAEFITVNPQDPNYPIAVTLLLAISYLLFLIFCILVRILNYRLLFILPTLFFATLLVSLRSFRLRHPLGWSFSEALIISILTTQLATALHYWPISPLSYGLALFGVAYPLFLFLQRLKSNPAVRVGYVEPMVILIISWSLAYWLK
ncbi:MAG: hypothetical protein Kow0088_10350 [Anaerolineales bacterium]